jgi:hypothetical protein
LLLLFLYTKPSLQYCYDHSQEYLLRLCIFHIFKIMDIKLTQQYV